MTDPWAWWRAALANPKEIGKSLKMTTTPEQGFYRRRLIKDGPWVPVAIWFDTKSGKWLATRTVDGADRDVIADDEWTHCGSRPITLEEYERVAERGEEWSDVEPEVGRQRRMPKPGDNETASEVEILRDQIDSSLKAMGDYAEIKDADHAGKAQSLRARLNELSNTADKHREAEKRPHLDAGKAVDKQWMPLVTDAKDGANKLRKALEVFETKKLQEQRKREEDARRADEEARRRAEAPSFEDFGTVAPQAPPPAESAPETTIKGAYGRAASIGSEFVVTSFDDYDKLYGYMKDRPEVRACLEDLARRAVKAGRRDIPGITIGEKATVK